MDERCQLLNFHKYVKMEDSPSPLGVDLGTRERGHLLRHLDERYFLDVTACEDDVDLLERPSGSFGIKEVNERQEAEAVGNRNG